MVYIVNFGSSKTPDIASVVKALNYECTIVHWNKPEQINFEKATAFILSGAPILLTETAQEPYLKKYQFIKTTKLPVLGICFGHQLIGLLFDAQVFKADPIRKPTIINITTQDKLFEGLNKQPVFIEDHTEGIDLPKEFIQLARSDKYEVEAMKHCTKNIYGVQFHPEVSGENGKKLIKKFLAITQ